MKTSLLSLPILSVALLLASCGGDKSADSAMALYNSADSAFNSADYSRSILLLDSLQKRWPGALEAQRLGMQLRPKVIEQATLLQISTNDSLMALDKVEAERLTARLKWVRTPQMVEGYWVGADGYNPDFMSSTGIQGRVSKIGEFYIVSSVKPSNLGHTSVALSAGSAEAATEVVPYDGESNYRIGGSEVITFSPAQSDTIGSFAFNHPDTPMTLTFRGKSSRSVKLTSRQAGAIADAWAYARVTADGRRLAVERQRLEGALQVARNQIARTAAVDE